MTSEPKITVVLGDLYQPQSDYQARWAEVQIGGQCVLSELVYDTRESPAEKNIMSIFTSRLARLLDGD